MTWLWRKAWIETRARFLLSLAALLVICDYQDVRRALRFVLPSTEPSYFYGLIHFADDTMCVLWVGAVTLLGMGGILREKALGSASFTLTLPVSRAKLMRTRMYVVLLESACLIAIPWIAIVLTIGTAGKPRLLQQAWAHVFRLALGGSIFIALPLLVSSLVEGEYTAPVVCMVAVIALAFGFSPALHEYDPFVFILGNDQFNRATGILRGPLPWVHGLATVALAILIAAAAIKAIQKREF